MKKAETQEQEFLEVCSSYDHDLLTGKKEMTLKDYERITYLVSSLGYSQYLQFLIGKYMDLAQADEEREEREHEIYLEYPEYYEDEGILEEEEKWLEGKTNANRQNIFFVTYIFNFTVNLFQQFLYNIQAQTRTSFGA